MAEPKRSTFQRLKKGQLNRKERRDLERRLNTEDPGLEIVNRNVAGIDVGNESHYVAVPRAAIRNRCRSSAVGRQIWRGWPTG